MFIATMEFITYLCVIISVTLLVIAAENRSLLSVTPSEKFSWRDPNVYPWAVHIPNNSWWRSSFNSSWSPKDPIGSIAYQSVKYLKDIPETENQIRLDYDVQYLDVGIFWNSWVTLSENSVLLCDNTTDTQNARIIGLIREVLGIPEGCPVSAGSERKTRAPFKKWPLLLEINGPTPYVRILTNMWENNQPHAQKLFTGTFYVTDYEEGDYYKQVLKYLMAERIAHKPFYEDDEFRNDSTRRVPVIRCNQEQLFYRGRELGNFHR